MKKLILSISLIAGIAFNSFSQQKDKPFKVDPSKSSLQWLAKKVTGSHKGNIDISSGSFTTADKTLTGGTFELNVSSVTVTDVLDNDSNAKLVKHLKSDDFFSTEKFPTSTFVITSAVKKDGTNYDITGNLTIKGITNPVNFPATIKIEGTKITAIAVITVDRTKYDIKFRSANFFENLGDKAISNDFTLNVNLVANQ